MDSIQLMAFAMLAVSAMSAMTGALPPGERGPVAGARGRPGDGVAPDGRVDREELLLRRLDRLAALIAEAPLNLVSAAERPHVRTRHLDEAVAVAAVLPCRSGERWMDLGTGGGLPGLVLAACRTDVRWVLVDSTRKKTQHVERFVGELGLDNVLVLTGRAEVLAHAGEHRARFDGVVARAVAPLAVLAELARGFIRDGGILAALKGPAWQDEVTAAATALSVLRYGQVHSEALPSPVRSTWLVTIPTEGSPPEGYPRRNGIPRTDPLR